MPLGIPHSLPCFMKTSRTLAVILSQLACIPPSAKRLHCGAAVQKNRVLSRATVWPRKVSAGRVCGASSISGVSIFFAMLFQLCLMIAAIQLDVVNRRTATFDQRFRIALVVVFALPVATIQIPSCRRTADAGSQAIRDTNRVGATLGAIIVI
jgi:hypothetical protein